MILLHNNAICPRAIRAESKPPLIAADSQDEPLFPAVDVHMQRGAGDGAAQTADAAAAEIVTAAASTDAAEPTAATTPSSDVAAKLADAAADEEHDSVTASVAAAAAAAGSAAAALDVDRLLPSLPSPPKGEVKPKGGKSTKEAGKRQAVALLSD